MVTLKSWIITGFLTTIIALSVIGCGKKPNIEMDSQKTVDGVKTTASEMDIKSLKSHALAYSKEIQKTKTRMKELQAELKQLKPDELIGDKGSEIKSQFASLTLKATQLAKRYDVYAQKYLQEGGNIADITAS